MKIILCDSNSDYGEIMEILLNLVCARHNIQCDITKITDEKTFLGTINNIDFDVLFMGIKFKTTNGIELAKQIKDKNKIIIFLTYLNVFELARDIYKFKPYKVILKEDIKEIELIMKNVINMLNHVEINSIVLENKEIIKQDINYIIKKDKMHIITNNQVIILKNQTSYTDLRKILNDKYFISDYENYFVNLDNVTSIKENKLYFGNNNISVPYSDIEKIKFYFYSTH